MIHKSTLDKEILAILYFLNNSDLKMYKNRLNLILEITNDKLGISNVNIGQLLDLLTEKNIITYKYNDFGKYYLPKFKIKLSDYDTDFLDNLSKINSYFKNNNYKEINQLYCKGVI